MCDVALTSDPLNFLLFQDFQSIKIVQIQYEENKCKFFLQIRVTCNITFRRIDNVDQSIDLR